jgi:prefoldin alpha subunit
MMELRLIESRIEALMKHREMVANRIVEIDNTAASIEELSKAKGDVLFHVGGEAFYPAKPTEKGKVLVMLGADIALEKTPDEARSLLQKRKKEAEDIMAQVQSEVEKLSKEAGDITQYIEASHNQA